VGSVCCRIGSRDRPHCQLALAIGAPRGSITLTDLLLASLRERLCLNHAINGVPDLADCDRPIRRANSPHFFHAGYHVASNGGLESYGVKNRPYWCVMAALDFIVIGFGSFVAIAAVGIVTLLAAYRH